ncbi:B12-binding domain-containing radical SAM protein [Brevifollis gellanilyticus]|uniref:B12-binding domain-containing radical SAM protein n=1 Tax=Brevifollis gellanilyticus TaxID=748831 RepID=A0A512M3C9_9BACT|nr:B12-binding domain-containing radical SAM protein [Brevifollis gellanilyticus]GEP41232.1 B12-binding domain-containing radical SAM protein [Brevifollis gellanilyticus]
MPDIVLATLNAKYIHASFGLRYLMANLGGLRDRACMAEFVINQQPLEIVEAILAHQPRIVGFGVYIWNVEQTTEVVALLKRIRPELIIIVGGPEVSYETEGQEIVALVDHVITGEADVKFAEVCRALLNDDAVLEGGSDSSLPKVIAAELPALNSLAAPYDLYTDEDLKNRVIYVEASRGCPFTCEFCLSSLDIPVRAFATEAFLASMQRLLDRGATQFKFVDRTFNLHLPTSMGILQFFLDRWRDGLFLHFEMVPDRLPEQLRDLIKKFPAGAVQFEVGIQTFDEATSKNISRRQNLGRLEDNFRFLREETGVHIHADLIVGLPSEGIESFGRGFDRLVHLGPQEIQVGILKRLRGTPIVRHDDEHHMIYAPHPPYEILSTRDIPFADMQRMRRFARYWDMVANSGHFTSTLKLLWQGSASPFAEFLRFSDWLHLKLGRTHQIALHVIAQSLFDFLVNESALDHDLVATTLEADWHRTPSRAALNLRGHHMAAKAAGGGAKRQARHAGTPAKEQEGREVPA